MRISDWSSDVCSSDLEAGMMQPFHLSGRSWKGRASALYFERAPIFKAKITAPTVSLQRSACGRISTEKFAMHLISSIDSTKARLLKSAQFASLWRSEERRVGQECVSTCTSGGWPLQ